MIYLSKKQILLLHADLIHATGGVHGLRDEALLESALRAPLQTFEATEIYPSLLEKGARLGSGLVKNHPFIDGNKRIGAHAMLTVLELNSLVLSYTQNELSEMFLCISAGKASYEQLLEWVIDHQL